MQVKSLMVKKVEPIFAEHGFNMTIEGRSSEYWFMNDGKTRAISFDRSSYLPKLLRTSFHVYGAYPFALGLEYFYPEFCPSSAMTYNTQEELEQYLNCIVRDTVSIILPYLDVVEQNYICETYEMSKALSCETAERVRRFANTWGLSMEPCQDNKIKLDEIMRSMNPDINNRKKDFYRHENEIIDLTAYFGELILISEGLPGKWMWREIHEGYKCYVVEFRGFDPLMWVIGAWNFGRELSNCAFENFPI